MNTGGRTKERSTQIFRYGGLFISTVLVIYGILILAGNVIAPHLVNVTEYGFLIFWAVALGFIQFVYPTQSQVDSALRLVAFHLLAGVYLVFVTGISTPVVILWFPLILASYQYFSINGYLISSFSLLFFIALDVLVLGSTNELTIILDLVTLISVMLTALILITLSQTNKVVPSATRIETGKDSESLQRDRVSTIVNNLADAVISTDKDGVIKIYNAACLSLLDTNDNLNGRFIDEVLPLRDADRKHVRLFKEMVNSKTVSKRDDLFIFFSEDDRMRLEITYSPIRRSYTKHRQTTHDGYVIIMRDITKQKSLEEERDEFISVISHELRTPITIVEGSISNLQLMASHPDVTKTMLADALSTAHDQILYLAGMVNDLSTLSRAERGVGDSAEDIDIKELATAMHNKYTPDAKAKKLHLNLDISGKLGVVHTSRLYLEELLQNFITNAIKYTKTGSVTISIHEKNGVVTFLVKDTGIGISKSDQKKVFDKFFRSEDYRTRETSGTGLGLYVAAKLAHKLGTKITLTSRLNFGSKFSFTLPLMK